MKNEPLAYNLDDAAKAIGLSRSELYRCVNRGELTLRKHGKRSIIAADDLRKFISQLPATAAAA